MKRDWIYIIIAFLISSCVFFAYYLLTKDTKLDIVYKNWDGPSYVLASLSLYDPAIASANNFIHSGDIHPDWTWLPAHFPLYPLLIRALSFLGYFQAMLLISLGATLATYLAFYELVKVLKITQHPLALTLPLIFLSPRWFVVSHTGSNESLFLFFLIMFARFLHLNSPWRAAFFLLLAQVTRPHAIFLLFGVGIIALVELYKSRNWKQVVRSYHPYLMVPLGILAVFSFYRVQTGNFWAFFDAIKLTHNLQGIPFATFSYPAPNIETFWQEVNAYDYLLYFAGCLLLFRQKLWRFGIVALAYFIPLIFLKHSDISRYAIPLLPFAFIAYRDLIEKREFTLATLCMSPAIMLYAINFMDHNHGI